MLDVVRQVASLAEGAEIPQPVIARVVIQVRGRQDNERGAEPGSLHDVRPRG